MSDLLKSVYIRARPDDVWGSFSLQELQDKGQGYLVHGWFSQRIMEDIIGIKEGELYMEAHLENMVKFLDSVGIEIAKMKEGERG